MYSNFQQETLHALTVALEASRSEAAALKVAYKFANDKYEETKSAYDSLLQQLKEEVITIIRQDIIYRMVRLVK